MPQPLMSPNSSPFLIKDGSSAAYAAPEKSLPATATMAMQLRSPIPHKPARVLPNPSFSGKSMAALMIEHPIPCLLSISLLFFMGVEYTLRMVPSTSPPVDVGFFFTESFHGVLAGSPALNSILAAVNTVFVVMQVVYILWVLVVEGRPRPTVAALFMFTCRGVLGYCTQLPLPQGFLGSGADFPVGNVSFFLFFSGHAGGAVIASLDMRRMGRQKLAVAFDILNCLQALRLLATRGHYTIDLAAGIGAGFIFDVLSGIYENRKFPPPAAGHLQNHHPCCKCRCD